LSVERQLVEDIPDAEIAYWHGWAFKHFK